MRKSRLVEFYFLLVIIITTHINIVCYALLFQQRKMRSELKNIMFRAS